MRRVILLLIHALACNFLNAQFECHTVSYTEFICRNHSVREKIMAAEVFIRTSRPEIISGINGEGTNSFTLPVITIPVVFHILYKDASQNVADKKIQDQLEVLNKAFQSSHADTSKIPSYFRELAVDCRFKFVLAKVDPQGRATSGIVRKSTSITMFGIDDRIKYSSQGGDDAWDSDKYLNVWVGSLAGGIAGYSSPIGGPKDRDGVSIRTDAFGPGNGGVYSGGKTLVHEVGHWMGLRHIWGDATCGDDLVDDTPKQKTANRGCPSGIRVTCENTPYGDNYNNYMDQVNDECMLMFTRGQMNRMRIAFEKGGPRHAILSSNGYNGTPTAEASLPEEEVISVKLTNIYPNPTQKSITIEVLQNSLLGSDITILNQFGQSVQKARINQLKTLIDVTVLPRGVYFIRIEKQNEKFLERFVKM